MSVIVPIENIRVGAPIPNEIQSYININEWADITRSRQSAETAATCTACATEWLACLFCCLPLCLCHGCIQPQIAKSDLDLSLRRINNTYYGGHPVCQSNNNYLVFHTQLIPYSTPTFTSAEYVETVNATSTLQVAVPMDSNNTSSSNNEVSLSKSNQSNYHTVSTSSSAPAVSRIAPERVMEVTVPKGCQAGSQLTVRTPEGLQIQAVVPTGIQPGQKFRIMY